MRSLVFFLFLIFGIYFYRLLSRLETVNAQMHREVAERQKAEQAYHQILIKNELILDSAGEGIYGLDPHGEITFFNKAASRITGYTAEELTGRNIHEALHHSKANGTSHPLEECPIFSSLRNGEVRQVAEDVFWTKDGKSFPVEYVSAPIQEGGENTGVVVIFRDITQRQRAEQNLKQAKDYLENVLDNSADAIGIVDHSGKIIKWNKAATTVFGYSFQELQGESAFELYKDKNELEAMLAQLRRDGFVRRYEIAMKRRDGTTGIFALSISLLYQDKNVVGSVCVARDRSDIKRTMAEYIALNEQLQKEVAERTQMEAALQEAKEKLEGMLQEFTQRNLDITLLNELGDVLQACLTCREACTAIAHLAPQLFPNESGALFVLNDSKTMLQAVAVWGEPLQSEQVFAPDECWAFRRGEVHKAKGSQTGLICQHLTSQLAADSMCIPLIAQGEIMGTLLLQSRSCRIDSPDTLWEYLTDSKQRLGLTLAKQISLALANLALRETLRSQAIRDPLTGLFNRRYMEETLDREMQRVKRRQKTLGVIMLDLDYLKPINDTFGHEAGDKVLVTLADFLKTHVRQEDIACRYGGDEFTLILPEATLETTRERAEQLRESISRLQVDYLGQSLGPISASLGVATYPEHGASGEVIIRAADTALFGAKQEGRNCLQVATRLERAS